MLGAASTLLGLLWLMRLPCMPSELGGLEAPPPPVAPAPPDAPLRPPVLPRAAREPGAASVPLPPPLAMKERLRYRVDYGVLNIGEIELSVDGARASGRAPRLIAAAGHGEGAILGFGRVENRIETLFDARDLAPRRWTSTRRDGDGALRDRIDQPRLGQIQLVRERQGAPIDRQFAARPGAAYDPIGFLLRLRVAPPPPGGPPQVLEVLDGRALWRVTVAGVGREAVPGADGGAAGLRFEARADPIRYDGTPDPGDRPSRTFVLWLSDDDARLPLRLEMPIGIGDVVVALVGSTRAPPL
jgi:hypothetical protein